MSFHICMEISHQKAASEADKQFACPDEVPASRDTKRMSKSSW